MQNCDVMDNSIPSIWCKRSNCRILHLIFQIFSDNRWQRLWKKLLFGQFCVSTSCPLLTILGNTEQKLRQTISWVCNIVKGERWNFKHTFKSFHTILSLIVWNLQREKKNEILCMLFQKTQMSFNEPDYVMVDTVMNMVTPNSAKMTQKMSQ